MPDPERRRPVGGASSGRRHQPMRAATGRWSLPETITRAHDGTLTLTPRPSGGIRVTVELPAPSPDERASGLSGPPR